MHRRRETDTAFRKPASEQTEAVGLRHHGAALAPERTAALGHLQDDQRAYATQQHFFTAGTCHSNRML